ncbi:prolyl oligopeptidase [Auriculariales sp. MPI-PUGE-AT-0066]|nr:prolyl oligopeptidase [Auriculariales sp. MPI-PUGE-AT-0066]
MATFPFDYPLARRSDHVDVFQSAKHGEVHVPDPYEWLEHDSEETDAWIDAQIKMTNQYLDQAKDREKLAKDFRESWNYAKVRSPPSRYRRLKQRDQFTVPIRQGDGRWYWSYNSGLEPQWVVRRTIGSELPDFNAVDLVQDELFFDGLNGSFASQENLLSEDKTWSIQQFSFSEDGNYFAYAGSDFQTIYVRQTDSPLCKNEDGSVPDFKQGQLEDEICFVKFSRIAWTADSKGFFYGRYPEHDSNTAEKSDKPGIQACLPSVRDKGQKLYYHRISSSQTTAHCIPEPGEDILVYEDPSNPDFRFEPYVTYDGQYLIMTTRFTGKRDQVYIGDLNADAALDKDLGVTWIKVEEKFEAEWKYLFNDGTKFTFHTNKDAPRKRIVSFDLSDSSFALTDVLPEENDATLVSASLFATDHVAVRYSRNVNDELYVYKLEGGSLVLVERVASDWLGALVPGETQHKDQPYFMTLASGFTSPGIVANYDMAKPQGQRWTVIREHVVPGLVPTDFICEQVWFTSKDETKVPMFIIRHRDTPLDGTAPAFQYGYGGFANSTNPRFLAAWLTFVKRYRAIAVNVNIRGGSEFGEDWHQQGVREKRLSEWLVDNKFASRGKIILNGASNGGLVVATCVNIAPEGLFGAAVAEVSVLDLLKFHQFTIGKAWISDYGNPSDPSDFDFIHPLSPLHNVPRHKTLPAMLFFTADHDDRVVPLHSFKYVAELQHTCAENPNPLLLRVQRKSGHGAGKTTEMMIGDMTDRYAFAAGVLDLKYYDD